MSPPYQPPSYDIARAEDNTLVFGPSNCIWLIACDHKDPVNGHASEAGMWWRFANVSDPAADGHIFRMNNSVTFAVDEAANEPEGFVSTLAQAIGSTNELDCEDICLFWHGVHITRSHANTPYRLHNADEEYYGQVHRKAAITPRRHATDEEVRQAREANQNRLAPSRGNLHADFVDEQDQDETPYLDDPDNLRIVRSNNAIRQRNRDVFAADRDKRRNWDEMFMFNWPDHESYPIRPAPEEPESGGHGRHGRRHRQARPDPGDLNQTRTHDWPTRYDNPNYMAVVRAFHNHPHVRRIHLYGCDLADPEYLKPILNLTKDIAQGDPQQDTMVTNKEIWVYSDFTETDWYGERMFISHTRRNPVAQKGARDRSGGGYEVVRLHTEFGPLPGWQVRGRIVDNAPIVEKLLVERGGTRRHPTVSYKIDKINASGISTPRTETVRDRTVTTSHYTPFETVDAEDPTEPPPPPPPAEESSSEH